MLLQAAGENLYYSTLFLQTFISFITKSGSYSGSGSSKEIQEGGAHAYSGIYSPWKYPLSYLKWCVLKTGERRPSLGCTEKELLIEMLPFRLVHFNVHDW